MCHVSSGALDCHPSVQALCDAASEGGESGGNDGNDGNDGDGGNTVQYEEDDFEVKGDGITLIFHRGRLTHIVNKNGTRKEKGQTEHTLNICN